MVSTPFLDGVWSPRLPDPNIYHWTTFTGLAPWFNGFPSAERKEICRALWAGPPRDNIPNAVWEGLLDVHALAHMYGTVLSRSERESFDAAVRWTGGDPPLPAPPPTDPGFPPAAVGPRSPANTAQAPSGFCYLVAFTTSAQDRAKLRLGSNPRGPELAAVLLQETGSWAPGRFRLTISREVKTNGALPYLQSHLEACDTGAPLGSLLPFLSSAIRVGADGDRALLAVPPEPAVSTGRPTMFDLVPRAPQQTVKLGGYATMSRSTNTGTLGWQPFKSAASTLMLGIYESVRLKSMDVVIYIPKGSSTAVYFAVVSNDSGVSGDDWFSAPINDTFQGSDQGAVTYRWALPEDHPFGKEYRAGVLGNGAPRFHWSLANTSAGEVRITVDLVFDVAGLAPLPRFNMSNVGTKSIADAIRGTNRAYRPMGTTTAPGVAVDDSDDEEDEPAPVRPAPARANRPS